MEEVKKKDFSKTVIYQFVCNDENIKCSYIGSTTNFSNRKSRHKYDCNTETSLQYKYKVYQKIREHGGWLNWTIKQLEEFQCENNEQKNIREQFWIDKLKPELNCIPSNVVNRYEHHLKSVSAYQKTHAEQCRIKCRKYHERLKEDPEKYAALLEKKKQYYKTVRS